MRALWSAATGMKSQQLNMDTISNNLANVNTTAYKKQKLEFKDLLYSNIRRNHLVEGEGSPVHLQMGHGVMPVATSRLFMQGSMENTGNPLDVALQGPGFFEIEGPGGDLLYTRDGSFKLSLDGDELALVTSDGYFVMSEFDDIIVLDGEAGQLSIAENGTITVVNEDGETEVLGTIKVVQFLNPQGLEAKGQNLYQPTAASGEAVPEDNEEMDTRIRQNYLETSNVQIVDEMVRMITAQRAYETNSKTIQTSDEMMSMANNLKR